VSFCCCNQLKRKTVEKTTGMYNFTIMKRNINTGKETTAKIKKKRIFCPIVRKR
jgi:hypothetical protein